MRKQPNVSRALPAAVFVPENTLKLIVERIAKFSQVQRINEEIILVKSGRYRANTDQVILYHHESRLPPPKADLVKVLDCKVSEVSKDVRVKMGSSEDDKLFLTFIRRHWDETLELDSPVTLIVCRNLRGELVESTAKRMRFSASLPSSSQE